MLNDEEFLDQNDNTLNKYHVKEKVKKSHEKEKKFDMNKICIINEKKTSRCTKKKNMKQFKKIDIMNDFIEKEYKKKNSIFQKKNELFLKTTKIKRKKSLRLYNKFNKSNSKSSKSIEKKKISIKKKLNSPKRKFSSPFKKNQSFDISHIRKSPLFMKSLKLKKNKIKINSLDDFSKDKYHSAKRCKNKKNNLFFVK